METYTSVLIAQLNWSGTDLPGVLVTQWIAWIQLFDFEVRHIPGQKYSTIDGLSQQPLTAANIAETEAEEDIDDFILAELNYLRVSPIFLDKSTPILANNYSDYSKKIAIYLTTIYQTPKMNIKEFKAFKKKVVKFKV